MLSPKAAVPETPAGGNAPIGCPEPPGALLHFLLPPHSAPHGIGNWPDGDERTDCPACWLFHGAAMHMFVLDLGISLAGHPRLPAGKRARRHRDVRRC